MTDKHWSYEKEQKKLLDLWGDLPSSDNEVLGDSESDEESDEDIITDIPQNSDSEQDVDEPETDHALTASTSTIREGEGESKNLKFHRVKIRKQNGS